MQKVLPFLEAIGLAARLHVLHVRADDAEFRCYHYIQPYVHSMRAVPGLSEDRLKECSNAL